MGQNLKKATKSSLRWTEISAKAERLLLDYKLEPGFDVAAFVATLGGTVVYQDFSEWTQTEDGSIRVYAPGRFEIFLSNFTGALRNRFTLAHELGHYFIHSNEGEIQIIAARGGENIIEGQANWFAGALLMPEEEFRRQWEKWKDDDYLAGHFQVSRAAVLRRKQVLSIGRE